MVRLGRAIAFYQVFFQQGRVALGKWRISLQKGHPKTPGMDFFFYSAQASFSWPRVDLALPLGRACSQSFGIISFEFVKVCGIRFSIWESFIGFYICCYFIYTILACLFTVGVGKSCVKREHGGEEGISCLLPFILLLYIE